MRNAIGRIKTPPRSRTYTQIPALSDICKNIYLAVKNAKAFLKVQEEFGSFDTYIWGFVDGKPIQNSFQTMSELPAKTELSEVISKDLKKRGF